MKKFLLFLFVFPLYARLIAQHDSTKLQDMKIVWDSVPPNASLHWNFGDNGQGFATLSDTSVIKKEIALFTITGAHYRDSLVKLVNIPLFYCSDSSAFLMKGDWISTERSIYINTAAFDTTGHKLIYEDGKLTEIDGKPFWGTNGEIPKRKITRVLLVYGEYRDVPLPPEFFNDLYEPITCGGYVKKRWRKPKPVSSVKAFRSVDRKRTYIYMHNAGYEVTWVISGRTVVARVLDKVD